MNEVHLSLKPRALHVSVDHRTILPLARVLAPARAPNRGKYLNQKSAEAKAHGSIRGFFRHNQTWLPRKGTANCGHAREA